MIKLKKSFGDTNINNIQKNKILKNAFGNSNFTKSNDFFETFPLVEQHIHGGWGIDFNTCEQSDVVEFAKKIKKRGIGTFYPTLVTDTFNNLKRQIEIIFNASKIKTDEMADIAGIHLEAVFLNPDKKGIHDKELFKKPTIDNYKQLEHEFIKIVTLAPELCEEKSGDKRLIEYLKDNGVKVQAGHCTAGDLSGCDGTTHTFNAMSPVSHKNPSTALQALINDNLYTEIICDGRHVSADTLKLLFKAKPINKILLVSDCLPCAGTAPGTSYIFAGQNIVNDGEIAQNAQGTLAGSVQFVSDTVKNLRKFNIIHSEDELQQLIQNLYDYNDLNIDEKQKILWNKNSWDIIA